MYSTSGQGAREPNPDDFDPSQSGPEDSLTPGPTLLLQSEQISPTC